MHYLNTILFNRYINYAFLFFSLTLVPFIIFGTNATIFSLICLIFLVSVRARYYTLFTILFFTIVYFPTPYTFPLSIGFKQLLNETINFEKNITEALLYSSILHIIIITISRYKLKKSLLDSDLVEIDTTVETPNEFHGQILVGKNIDSDKSSYINLNDLNTHLLVIGTTGSGKTVSLSNIVEHGIKNNIPVIYIDGKGDEVYGSKFISFSKKHNKAGYIFSLSNKESCTYNPLFSGGFTSKKDRIIELRNWSEEHYKKIAEGYIQVIFKVLDHCRVKIDLFSVISFLDRGNLLNLLRKNKHLDQSQELMNEVNALESIEKDISSIIFELKNIINSEIGHLFNTTDSYNNLIIKDLIQNNEVAYFSLPALEFPSYAKLLGKLIINDIKASINSNSKPIILVFDEFSVFAGQQILNLINMGRSNGVHAIISTQSLADISISSETNGESFSQQILSNCNNYMVHRLNSPADAEMMSSLIGTKDSFNYTSQINNEGTTGLGTAKRTKEFAIHPDKIKQLKKGQMILINKNTNEISSIQSRLGNLYD